MQKSHRCLHTGLKGIYQQPGAAQYNLNETLDALVTLTDRSQKTVHSEQQKKFLELSNKPTLVLYMGFPEQFVPSEIKNQRLQTFLSPPGKGANPGPPRGSKTKFSNKKVKRANQGSMCPSLKKGNPNVQKIKKILELLNL